MEVLKEAGSQAWQLMLVILRLRKQRQEDRLKLKASPHFRVGDPVSKPDSQSVKEVRDEGQGKAVWCMACLLCHSNR